MSGMTEGELKSKLTRLRQISDLLHGDALSAFELATLRDEADAITYCIVEALHWLAREEVGENLSLIASVEAFMDRLKNRQGTTMPDLDALYEKRAKLDQNLKGYTDQ